jgi:hypothetical protein
MRLQLGAGKFDGKQLIVAAALAETHRPQIVSRPPENAATDRAGYYALGWNVNYDDTGRVRLGHSGAFDLGAATAVSLLPAEQLGIVVLTNAAPTGVPEAVSASFLDVVINGKVQKDWFKFFAAAFKSLTDQPKEYSKPPANALPPLASDAYIGAYRNELFGLLEVVEMNRALHLRLGPKKNALALRHWDRDVFIYEPVGEMASGLSGVTFRIGPDRRAVTVTVENLDVHGQGTFTRLPAKK